MNEPAQRESVYMEILSSCERELKELEQRVSFISTSSPELCEAKTPTPKTLLETKLLYLLGRINGIKESIKL